jgi:uncharacterized protein YyaL (SSP411 family)
MSVAGRILKRDDYVDSAQRALDFVRGSMMADGRLLATSRDGTARLNAYLDDHALLIDGILSLLECRWRDGDLDFALTLADALLDRFYDEKGGGFFFTSHDHEQVINRPKPMADDALPSGNGVAARVLLRLGHLSGRTDYLRAAESTLRAAWEPIVSNPHAHNTLLSALEEYLVPPTTIILRGEDADLARWQQCASQIYLPTVMILAIPSSTRPLPELLAQGAALAASTGNSKVQGLGVAAYVCRGTHCEAPITDRDAFEVLLSQLSGRSQSILRPNDSS